jgi:hypothetical protein
MITADQIVCHMIGDYVLQSDWMANQKTKSPWPCLAHVLLYSIPFILWFQPSFAALAVIISTHYYIDRYRLARYICWFKNFLAPKYMSNNTSDTRDFPNLFVNPGEKFRNYRWQQCTATGYNPNRPVWMTVWLMIITDNLMHILINGLALRYL